MLKKNASHVFWNSMMFSETAWIVGKLVRGFKARLETYGATLDLVLARISLAFALEVVCIVITPFLLHACHLIRRTWPDHACSILKKTATSYQYHSSRLWAKNSNARTACCWPSWTSKDRLKCPTLHQILKAASLLRKIIESLWRVSPVCLCVCVSFIGPNLGWDPTLLAPLSLTDPRSVPCMYFRHFVRGN